jgi:hypothetical protein
MNAMKSAGHTKLFWTALIIGMAWSVYSSTAELLAQVNCLKESLFISGNTWFINSVI